MTKVLIFSVLCLAYAVQTRAMTRVWQDEPSLWAQAKQITPESPAVLVNEGTALALAGRYADAEWTLREAFFVMRRRTLPSWSRFIWDVATVDLQSVEQLRGR